MLGCACVWVDGWGPACLSQEAAPQSRSAWLPCAGAGARPVLQSACRVCPVPPTRTYVPQDCPGEGRGDCQRPRVSDMACSGIRAPGGSS